MRAGRISVVLSIVLAALVAALAALTGAPRGEPQRAAGASAQVKLPSRGVAVEITLGLKGKEPADWSGELALTEGSILSLEAVGGADNIEGHRWTLRTRQAAAKAKAKGNAKAQARKAESASVVPVKLIATLDAPPTATVELTTRQGRASFRLGDIAYAKRTELLDGSAAAERVFVTRQVTSGSQDDDFPAIATARDGSFWCVCMSYRHGSPIDSDDVAEGRFDSLVPAGHGDQIRLLHFEGDTWSEPIDITEPGLDAWRPAVAVDGRGTVWVVWSQNNAGNWDLYARSYDPVRKAPGEIKRLTTDGGADINVVAAGGGGQVWLAWQAWRSDNFDILAGTLDADGVLHERRISTSPANDWSPALTVGKGDEAWVAWDTYDRGNYDVVVRRCTADRLDEPIPVAASPRFEARPSLALDPQGRLWVAFEDADANWGKDYGDRFEGKQGMPFYLERHVVVRCVDQGQVWQTKAPVTSQLMDTFYDDPRKAREERERISFPRLCVDGQGNLWLLYRRHPLRSGEGERWVSFATRYEGAAWGPAVMLRQSDNLLDNRPALTALKSGGLLAVYSSDGRTAGSPSARINHLSAARIDAGEAPQEPPALAAASVKGDGKPVESVHPDEAGDRKRIAAYRVNAGGKTYRLLRGEFHRHSEISSHRDWDGPLEEIWRYGLDVAAMDWIGPGDHEYGVAVEYLWWLTQKQIDIYHHAPKFVPMFTYERSLPYPSGHRNVMFARRGIRPLPQLKGQEKLFGTPEKGAPDVKNLYAYLKKFDGLCSSHTSATSMGTDWRDNDPEVEPVVEIFQGHRQNYEEPHAPMAARTAEESIQGYHPDGFVWQALAKGYRLGFQSSSDHVSTHISYAIVLAEEPSRAGVLTALKKRHSYAANDNIILDVRCGDHLMGDEFTIKDRPRLEISALGTASIARVDIIRQTGNALPVYVYNIEPKQAKVQFRWTDEAIKPGEHAMYYVRIAQEDKKLAWASPLWVTYQP